MTLLEDWGDADTSFLQGGGSIAELIRRFDWAPTELGAIGIWPPHVKVATSLMLRSVVPIVMLWGETGVMIYNDAYSRFAGLRHPSLLGSKVREGWPEVADFNDNVMREGLAGRTLSYRDQELTLYRNDRAEQVWMNLDYSPLLDHSGRPAGVMAIVVETTDKVRAERRLLDEHARQAAQLQRREQVVQLAERAIDARSPADVAYASAELIGRELKLGRVGYGHVDHEAETVHIERDWCAPGIASLRGVLRLRDHGTFVDGMKANQLVVVRDVRTDERARAAAGALERLSIRAFVSVPVIEHGRLVAVFFASEREPRDWADDELAFVRDVGHRTHILAERARSELALRASELRLREANEQLEAKVEARRQELMRVEAQYRQSQKMEAIGQLTGGIAHDFNNLLHSVNISLEVLKRQLAVGKLDHADRYVAMSQNAVRRAASLTQRLLAFSRRQTLDPRPTAVNRLIADLEELIRRTVGPSIAVGVVGAGGLWLVRVDASQVENALLNLCINARDAMQPAGGRLTIETANKWLDARSAAERELPPGQYVSVCVTDTGSGMTPDVIAHAFDPFFTTKPIGEGTGLGLSMVYGFVRQSGGQVRIYSEPGVGTTMCLYLPRHVGDSEVESPVGITSRAEGADSEVILLIEDEATIRDVLGEELQRAGYQVISCTRGVEGVEILQSDCRIDLLLSDVGLPGGLNGRQVADAGRVTRPDLKVLFITGYAENAAIGNGLLAAGMEVITKPFDVADLLTKVRTILLGLPGN